MMCALMQSESGFSTPIRHPLRTPELSHGSSDSSYFCNSPATPDGVSNVPNSRPQQLLDLNSLGITKVAMHRDGFCAVKRGDSKQDLVYSTSPVPSGIEVLYSSSGAEMAPTVVIHVSQDGLPATLRTTSTLSNTSLCLSTLSSPLKRPLPSQDSELPVLPIRTDTLRSLPLRSITMEQKYDPSLGTARSSGDWPTCDSHLLRHRFTEELNRILSAKSLEWHREDAERCAAGLAKYPERRCKNKVHFRGRSDIILSQLITMAQMRCVDAIFGQMKIFVGHFFCSRSTHLSWSDKEIDYVISTLDKALANNAPWDMSIPTPVIQLKSWLGKVKSSLSTHGTALPVVDGDDWSITIRRWNDVEWVSSGQKLSSQLKGSVYERYRPDPQLCASHIIRKWLLKPLDSRDLNDGYLYVYWFPGNFGLVKIGYTGRSVKVRLDEWRNDCKHEVQAYADEEICSPIRIGHAQRLEALIHAELRPYRVRETGCQCGKKHIEWFKATQEHVRQVTRKWTRFLAVERYDRRVGGRLRRKQTPARLVEHLCTPLPVPALPRRSFKLPTKPPTSISTSQTKSRQGFLSDSDRLRGHVPKTLIPVDEQYSKVHPSKRVMRLPLGTPEIQTRDAADLLDFHPLLTELISRISIPRRVVQLAYHAAYQSRLQMTRYSDGKKWILRFWLRASALQRCRRLRTELDILADKTQFCQEELFRREAICTI